MSERSEKRGRVASCGLAVGVVCVLVAALYVLGSGPATWLGEHYEETQQLVATIYLPLALLAESCEPIGRALDWYVEFWI